MSGGPRKYLRNILPRMAAHPNVENILFALPESLKFQNWFYPMPNVRFVSCKPFRFHFSYRDVDLMRKLEEFSPDVIFVPFERYFHFKDVSVVNMVRNMEPLICPYEGNPISEILKNWLRCQNARKAVNKADRVIAVSEFVEDFLINSWEIPSDKIHKVYHGINIPEVSDCVRPFSIPKNWKGRFLFTAGSIRPARGLDDILFTMEYMVSHNMEMPSLVIAGESNANMVAYKKGLNDRLKKIGLSSKICWAGNLNEREMVWCYKNCRVFVMTSRVESFGQIALEAMSYGCTCISADNPCLPELFGDAALYYPPKDCQSLAEAIKSVLAWDDNQQKTMSEKAKKRAREFSWDVCAEKTVAELAKTVRDSKSK